MSSRRAQWHFALAQAHSPNAPLTKSKFLSRVPKTRRFQPSPALHIRYFICRVTYFLQIHFRIKKIHITNDNLLLNYISPKSSGQSTSLNRSQIHGMFKLHAHVRCHWKSPFSSQIIHRKNAYLFLQYISLESSV